MLIQYAQFRSDIQLLHYMLQIPASLKRHSEEADSLFQITCADTGKCTGLFDAKLCPMIFSCLLTCAN